MFGFRRSQFGELCFVFVFFVFVLLFNEAGFFLREWLVVVPPEIAFGSSVFSGPIADAGAGFAAESADSCAFFGSTANSVC